MVSAQVGDVVSGKVVKLQDFGAFVEIDADTTGLVHISEVHRDFVDTMPS